MSLSSGSAEKRITWGGQVGKPSEPLNRLRTSWNRGHISRACCPKGVSAGVFVLTSGAVSISLAERDARFACPMYKSELKAHQISKQCVQDCEKTCPGYPVKEGLNQEREWEDKNIFE